MLANQKGAILVEFLDLSIPGHIFPIIKNTIEARLFFKYVIRRLVPSTTEHDVKCTRPVLGISRLLPVLIRILLLHVLEMRPCIIDTVYSLGIGYPAIHEQTHVFFGYTEDCTIGWVVEIQLERRRCVGRFIEPGDKRYCVWIDSRRRFDVIWLGTKVPNDGVCAESIA